MDYIESSARISVGRACGFGLLAIVCTMAGLAGTPVAALKAGGYLCLLTSAILIVKARAAPQRPYKHTEVWLMLDEGRRPPAEVAQRLIAGALVQAFYEFAIRFAQAAAGLLASAIILLSISEL
jgi:hypothetical protein